MLKFLPYLSLLILFGGLTSCKNQHTYEKYVKELDSLKVVVQQAVDNFKTVDSAQCIKANSKYYTYSLFLNEQVKDTVSKTIAENLQNFLSVGNGLNDYLVLRSSWLNEANASVAQLNDLSHDLKNGSIDEEEAVEFINTEKKQAEKIIDELKINTESIRKHLEVYNQSLPACEVYIKLLNGGTLPTLHQPELKPINNEN